MYDLHTCTHLFPFIFHDERAITFYSWALVSPFSLGIWCCFSVCEKHFTCSGWGQHGCDLCTCLSIVMKYRPNKPRTRDMWVPLELISCVHARHVLVFGIWKSGIFSFKFKMLVIVKIMLIIVHKFSERQTDVHCDNKTIVVNNACNVVTRSHLSCVAVGVLRWPTTSCWRSPSAVSARHGQSLRNRPLS